MGTTALRISCAMWAESWPMAARVSARRARSSTALISERSAMTAIAPRGSPAASVRIEVEMPSGCRRPPLRRSCTSRRWRARPVARVSRRAPSTASCPAPSAASQPHPRSSVAGRPRISAAAGLTCSTTPAESTVSTPLDIEARMRSVSRRTCSTSRAASATSRAAWRRLCEARRRLPPK